MNTTTGDNPRVRGKRQCKICRKWFSSSTDAQGWKVHLSVQHRITLQTHVGGSDDSQTQTKQTMKTIATPAYLLRKYENAIIDYVIGGDISLRAAGEPQFANLIHALTNGYKPPSTRTIIRRTVELFTISQPLLLAKFLCSLDVMVSLTINGWSNRNLKGFYVVTAHWIDTTSG